jgi:uncharacterized protein YecT (DUF1311 family)
MKTHTKLALLALFASATNINCTQATDKKHACDLSKLPIARASDCDTYFLLDDKLNAAYKKLMASIATNESSSLRDAQRRWIKYRDEKCQYDEEKAFEACAPLNPSCENLELDQCVIQLTSDRVRELEGFLAKPDEARKKNFEFTRASRFGDENFDKATNASSSSLTKPK